MRRLGALLAVALSAACGGTDRVPGSVAALELSLVLPAGEGTALLDGVAKFRLEAVAAGASTPLPCAEPQTSCEVGFIPGSTTRLDLSVLTSPGRALRLTLRAFDATDQLMLVGRSGQVIPQESGPVSVPLFLAPLERFVAPPGQLRVARFAHSATLLEDGRVLVVGGAAGGTPDAPESFITRSEIYDPASGRFCHSDGTNVCLAAEGDLPRGRAGHSATRLGDGRVLILGGLEGEERFADSAAYFDPESGSFETQPLPAELQRAGHSATWLQGGVNGGQLLIAGGVVAGDLPGERLEAGALLVDPNTLAVQALDGFSPRRAHASCALGNLDGDVAFVGGVREGQALDDVLVYLGADGRMTTLAGGDGTRDRLLAGRVGATATVVPTGEVDVLIFGGATGEPGLEVLTQRSASARATLVDLDASAGAAQIPERREHSATALGDGSVLIVGGRDLSGDAGVSAQRFLPGDNPTDLAGAAFLGQFSNADTPGYALSAQVAVALDDGNALIVGGRDPASGVPLAQVRVFTAPEAP